MNATKIKPAPRPFDLQAFCDNDADSHMHVKCGRPFCISERVYATNGKIAIETHSLAEDEPIEEGPVVGAPAMFHWPEPMEWKPWPRDAVAVDVWGFCPTCDGTGYQGKMVDCPHCGLSFSEDRCIDCLGDPEGIFDWLVPVGDHFVDRKYYDMICKLPGDLKYDCVTKDGKNSVIFRITFDGGRALLVSLEQSTALKNIERAKKESGAT